MHTSHIDVFFFFTPAVAGGGVFGGVYPRLLFDVECFCVFVPDCVYPRLLFNVDDFCLYLSLMWSI